MQLLACQTSCPRTTSSVSWSALVKVGNWRCVSTVSTRKISAATPVDAAAKSRVCRLFMTRLRLNADAVPVTDADICCVQDRDHAERQHGVSDGFEDPVECGRVHCAPPVFLDYWMKCCVMPRHLRRVATKCVGLYGWVGRKVELYGSCYIVAPTESSLARASQGLL